jgi:hypothetical protein
MNDETKMNTESANIEISTTASAFAIQKKDPTLSELGTPGNLANCLPDLGVTQHMTPC